MKLGYFVEKRHAYSVSAGAVGTAAGAGRGCCTGAAAAAGRGAAATEAWAPGASHITL